MPSALSSGPGRPVRIVALGDSLVVGTGASAPDRGFVFQAFLRVRERHPGSALTVLAIGGATAAEVAAAQAPRLAGGRYDVAVLCVGGNDVVRRTLPSAFGAAYARTLRELRRTQPGASIVCCGVPDIGVSPLFAGAAAAEASLLAQRLNDEARRQAASAGARFVDLFAATDRLGADVARDLSADRFHPSDQGYRILADALAPSLLEATDGAGPLG